MSALGLPMADHPGGIDVDGDVLVVPYEHRDRSAWFGLWDLADPLYPRQFSFHDYPEPPEGSPLNRNKASAAGVVDTGDGYVVATLSENKWLRVSRGVRVGDRIAWNTHDPIDLEDAAPGDMWPNTVDSCSLLRRRPPSAAEPEPAAGGEFRLVLFGTTARRLTWWGDDSVMAVDLDVPPDGSAPRLVGDWISQPIPKPTDREGHVRQSWRDVLRPSTRWGATAFWSPGEDVCEECVGNLGITPPGASTEPTGARIELAVVEHSGNEFGPAIGIDGDNPEVRTQYLQFRSTLPLESVTAGEPTTEPYAWPTPNPFEVFRQKFSTVPRTFKTWRNGLLLAMVLFAIAVTQDSVVAGVMLAGLAASAGLAAVPAFLKVWEEAGFSRGWRLVLPWIGLAVSVVLAMIADWQEMPSLALVVVVLGLHFPPLISNWLTTWRARAEEQKQSGVAPPEPHRAGSALRQHARALRSQTSGGALQVAGWFDQPVRLQGLVVVLMAVLALSAGAGAERGNSAALWVIVALVALVAVKFLTPPAFRNARPYPMVIGFTLLAGLGLVIAAVVAEPFAIGAGVALAFGALSILGVFLYEVVRLTQPHVPHLAEWTPHRVVTAAASLLSAVIGFGILIATVQDGRVGALLGLVAALVGAFFVWPREGTFILILAGMVFVWAVADSDPERDDVSSVLNGNVPTATELAGNWHVVVGDSFISGEGADAFAHKTNTKPDNSCRRSVTAWPELVDQTLPAPHRTMSFACSGATLVEIVAEAQHESGRGINAGTRPQVDELRDFAGRVRDQGGTISHVFVSGGGNDAGFSDLIEACLIPSGDCSSDEVSDAFTTRARDLGARPGAEPDQLATTYRSVIEAIGDEVRHPDGLTVLVATYVDPIADYRVPGAEAPCSGWATGSLLELDEVAMVQRFRSTINTQIHNAVASLKDDDALREDRVWVDVINMEHALDSRSVCTDDAGVNWVNLRPPDDNIVNGLFDGEWPRDLGASQLLPQNWVNSSLHPNESGHRSMAIVADLCLESLVVAQADAASDDWGRAWACSNDRPAELPPPSACVEPAESDVDYCVTSQAKETTDELAANARTRAGRFLGAGAASTLMAGFLFAAFRSLPRRMPADLRL